MSTPNPCQLGSPVWPYPVLAGYPKTLHLNDYVATMDGTIPLVVSFLALATGNLPQVLFGKGLHVPQCPCTLQVSQHWPHLVMLTKMGRESTKDEALLFLISKLEARDLTHTSAINGMLFCRRGGRPGAIPALTSGTTHRH